MNIWALPSLVAATTLLGLTVYIILRRPPPPMWRSTLATLLSVLVFALGKAASYFTSDPQSYWIATAFSYTGLMFTGTSAWLLAHRFAQACGRPFRFSSTSWVYLPTLLVVPMWLAMLTNPVHGQFMTLNMNGPHGHHWIWFMQAGATYFSSLMAFVLYARLIFRVDSKSQRQRIVIMLIAPMVTISVNLIHMSPTTNIPFDPTPIALATTAILFLIGIYRVGIFSLTPVAMSAIIEHQPNGIVVTDLEGTLLYWNDAADKAVRVPLVNVDVNFDDWLSRKLKQSDGAGHMPTVDFKQRIENLPVESPLPMFCLVSDERHWVQIRVDNILSRRNKIVGRSYFIRDISHSVLEEEERLKLERKMFRSQKLEGIGLLAGGLAHDFNNLLMVIRGNADLLALNPRLDSDAREKVGSIESVSERAARLTRKLLVYSGDAPVVVTRLNLSELTRETTELISTALLPKQVSLALELEENCLIEGDQSQIEQVLMNLTINAGEAYEDASGTITVCTRLTSGSESASGFCLHDSKNSAAELVVLEVKDTGCGMDSESIDRIADPFFSSKSYGRGLGLSAVLGIVRSHRGSIYVDSEIGVGTCFRVLLPKYCASSNNEREDLASLD